MDKDHPLKIARLIAQEVMTDHGRTPVERVLRRHSQSIGAWREQGWTWGQIAALLAKGGLRLKDGTAVTERYLAAVFSRIKAKAKPPRQDEVLSRNMLQPSRTQTIPENTPFMAVTAPISRPRQPAPTEAKTSGREKLRQRMRASAAIRRE
jgi:hypothetical protein